MNMPELQASLDFSSVRSDYRSMSGRCCLQLQYSKF